LHTGWAYYTGTRLIETGGTGTVSKLITARC